MSASRLSIRELAEREGFAEQTVRGWTSRGVVVGDRRVRLPATRIGGRYWVEADAYRQFVAALNPTDTAAVAETPAARARRLADGKAGRFA